MKKSILFLIIFTLFVLISQSQNIAVNTDGSLPDSSAIIDIKSNIDGMLFPRLTRNEIYNMGFVAHSMIVYCTDDHAFYMYYSNDSLWHKVGTGNNYILHKRYLPGFICGDSIFHDSLMYGTVYFNKRCWLDRNLGAVQKATAINDALSYGGYYQWGRLTDGHEKSNSTVTTTLSHADVPGHNMFITSPVEPRDWRAPSKNSLWSWLYGINNPCPMGFRLPSRYELENISSGWATHVDGFNSILKLPSPGYRTFDNGLLEHVGQDGVYHTYTNGDPLKTSIMMIHPTGITIFTNTDRSAGFSVRCIKEREPPLVPYDHLPANDSVVTIHNPVLKWSCSDGDGDILEYVVFFGLEFPPDYIARFLPDTFLQLSGLLPDTTYFWRIKAYDLNGYASWSDDWSFQTGSLNQFICGDTIFFLDDTLKTVSHNNRCWLDRNLGADHPATSINDPDAYGDYYQWGRYRDGHQVPTSLTTSTLSTYFRPRHDYFITTNSYPYDWYTYQLNNLWAGSTAYNNPCPYGYYVPSSSEWSMAIIGWNNVTDAFNSPLKITAHGARSRINGTFFDVGNIGMYQTSNTSGIYHDWVYLGAYTALNTDGTRAYANPVRCVKKNQPPYDLTYASPTDGSTITSSYAKLHWTCKDPDGEELQYRIHLGLSSNPEVAAYEQADTFFIASSLLPDTTYFWKIMAIDHSGESIEGPVWSFNTNITNPFSCGDTLFFRNDTVMTVMHDNRCWMDRNLGAERVATSFTDADAYGDYYQWGRYADGHQEPTSLATGYLAAGDRAHHGFYILNAAHPYDWHSPQNDTLWAGPLSYNNPCPYGYYVTSMQDWISAMADWSNGTDAFNSSLKITANGERDGHNNFNYQNAWGLYHASTTTGTSSEYISIGAGKYFYYDGRRVFGRGVRCIKENQAPYDLQYALPLNWDTITLAYAKLHWTCKDPDGEALHYHIHLGLTQNPEVVAYQQPDTFYFANGLIPDTTCFWKIIAVDQAGETLEGPVWSFSTNNINPFVCGDTIFHRNDTLLTVIHDNRCWLDRNLGADHPATSINDPDAYGDYYQWGRYYDGHEDPSSMTTSALSSVNRPGHGRYILTSSHPYDWRVPQNDTLWGSTDSYNNPCPYGFYVPSSADWTSAMSGWVNLTDAFNSPLKLTASGGRSRIDGSMYDQGISCHYQTSSTVGHQNDWVNFGATVGLYSTGERAYSNPVRCIKAVQP